MKTAQNLERNGMSTLKTKTRKKKTRVVKTVSARVKQSKKKRPSYPKTIIPPPVAAVNYTSKHFSVAFKDGRALSVPFDWFPRLALANPEQRKNYEIGIMGIHWPDVDEDISVQGLLDGKRSHETLDVARKRLQSQGIKV